MQERRTWSLPSATVASASGPKRPPDSEVRPEGRPAPTLLPGAREEQAHAPPRPAAVAWTSFRPIWRAVLWGVYQKMNDDRLLAVAAGVVFYGLLALFPALTAFVSLYGLVADPSSIHERLSLVAGILPQGALDIVNEQLTRLTAHKTSALSFGFIGGLLLALWSANAGSKAIMDGLNVAYGESEKRSFLRVNLVALAFTLGAIFAMMLALSAVVIVPVFLSHFGLAGIVDGLVRILRWPLLWALVVLGLSVLYRYGPSVKDPHWTWLFPGNVIAAIGWLAASALFSWYLANFGTYDATYGSLGAAIGMMMWMWISVIVILLGAELNAETERETKRTSPVGS